MRINEHFQIISWNFLIQFRESVLGIDSTFENGEFNYESRNNFYMQPQQKMIKKANMEVMKIIVNDDNDLMVIFESEIETPMKVYINYGGTPRNDKNNDC